MAIDTNLSLRNQVIYSVFVRNFTEKGTFEGVRQNLKRIRLQGADVIWLMPIHPIGKKERKGTLGSPYAIQNYREINPEFGTLEEFKQLVDEIHNLGMKCIIDVVYNHTAPDSWLVENHPEWFYRKDDGSFGNHVGDWSDIIDLDYDQPELWNYQIETLKMWAEIVDGFRCDVAPMVPLAFWKQAREEVAKVRPDCLWLAESIEPEFLESLLSQNVPASTDAQLYQAFDITYDYDIYGAYTRYLEGKAPLSDFADAVNGQEEKYPENYVKLRFLENHDRPRAKKLIPDETRLLNWMAFLYFQKGTVLLYAGQEVEDDHTPSLFEKDPVNWQAGMNNLDLLRCLYEIKQDALFTDSCYHVEAVSGDGMLAVHEKDGRKLVGLFALGGEPFEAKVDIPDGTYENLLDGDDIKVKHGMVPCMCTPVIIKV